MGTGKRYAFDRDQVPALREQFDAWAKDQEHAAREESKGESRLAQAAREGKKQVDLDQMTIAQLKRRAQEHDIAVPSKMKRAELIAHLRERLTF